MCPVIYSFTGRVAIRASCFPSAVLIMTVLVSVRYEKANDKTVLVAPVSIPAANVESNSSTCVVYMC